jgi:hypothetical protein
MGDDNQQQSKHNVFNEWNQIGYNNNYSNDNDDVKQIQRLSPQFEEDVIAPP